MGSRRRLLLCTALLLGCTKGPAPRAEADSEQQTDIPAPPVSPASRPTVLDSVLRMTYETPRARDSLLQALFDYGLAFGETRAALMAGLGAPASAHTSTTEDPYTATTDTLFELRYPGLRFRLLFVSGDGREFLTNVELVGTDRELPAGIRCQVTTRATLARLLGKPDHAHVLGDTVVISYPRPTIGAEEYTQFYVVRDTVRQVRWALYVD